MARLCAIPSLKISNWPASDESTITFYLSPATLGEMASVKMALLLWHRRFDDYSLRKISSAKWIKTHRKYFTIKDLFVIHPAIESQLDRYVKIIASELENWIDYHFERVFYDSDLHSVIRKCYHELTCCGTDCTIDWLATARRLLKNHRLTQVEKYRLACLYCMRDDIKSLWASFWQTDPKTVYNSTLKPVILYWNDVMLDEISSGIGRSPDANLEKRMIAVNSKYPQNWATVLYFLKRLNWLEQTDQVILLLKYDVSYAIHLIPELNDEQLGRVMAKCGVAIWYHFAKKPRYFKYALRVWSYIRHEIGENDFYHFVSHLIDAKAAHIRAEGETTPSPKHTSALLFETWISAPVRLRKYVIDNYATNVLDIMYEYKSEMLRIANRDARFLLAILTDTSFHFRNDLWQRNWPSMIISVPPSYLNQMMILCLEDPEKISRYKKNIASGPQLIQRYCFLSIKEGYFEDVDDFLKVCSLPDEKIVNYKKDLLKSFRHHGHLIFQLKSVKKWQKFGQFVDEFYKNDEAARSYKKDMVFGTSTGDVLNKELMKGRLWYMDHFIGTFLSIEYLIHFKTKLVDQCREDLIRGKIYNFDWSTWREFFEWCSSNDGEKMAEFRASLPIDGIFVVTLKKCIKFISINDFFRKWADNCDFIGFDHFLRWFFGTVEGIRYFKLKKVYEYRGIDDLKAKLNIDSNEILGIVLQWFFGGNSNDLEEWKNLSRDQSYVKTSSKRLNRKA
ncbi:hypothetical protein U1Q18_044657 [Sarracenia purpurea var. burkii]